MDKIASLGASTLVLTSALAVFATQRMEVAQPSRLPTPFPLAADTDETTVALSDGRAVTLRQGQLMLGGRRIDLGTHRRFASLTVMPTGQVLIWGGIDDTGRLVETGEWIEPATGAVVTTGRLGLPVRAGHTLNVLTDGTLVMTGGWGEGNQPAHDVALWRPLDRRLTLERGDAAHVCIQGRATLLADGSINVIGGVDEIGRPVHDAWRFKQDDDATASGQAHGVAASYPARNRQDASPIGPLALRFDEPVDLKQLGGSVSLLGPNGVVKTRVIGAENGRLAFIQLPDELYPSARYTIFVQGLHTAKGDAVPYEAIGFTTKAARNGVVLAGEGKRPGTSDTASSEPPLFVMAGEGKVKPCKPADAFHLCRDKGSVKDGAFYPGQDNVATASGGHWRLYRDRQTLPDTRATEANLPKGDTALIGQVRRIDETPVANVAIVVDGQTVHTDARGVFVLSHLRSGRRELFVDGRPAGSKGVEYGRFVVGADVTAATVNHMPYVMYLPRVLERDKIALPSPTTRETVLTHPDMPGLELRIPAGAVFKDRDGKVLNEIAIVPTPVDHAPFPLPDNFPMYFTIQPGDAVVQGMTPEAAKGIQVVYPNYGKQKPADKADFWVYSAERGWEMYGAGHVSADASQLVADNDTRLVWALGAGASTNPPENDNDQKPDNKCAGDPVDLATGNFFRRWMDLSLNDVIPIGVDRTATNVFSVTSPFGLGSGTSLAMTLSSGEGFQHPKIVMSCGEAIVFDLVSGQPTWPLVGTVWRHSTTSSRFYGATLQFLNDATPEGAHWVLTQRDGSQYWFDRHAPNKLARYMDRFGNTVRYVYDSGLLTQVISPNGRSITFTYNDKNLIASASDASGRVVRYGYHLQKGLETTLKGYLLDRVDYPDGTWETYTYHKDTSGSTPIEGWWMESIVDRRGNTQVVNTYDVQGAVIKQTYADGSTNQFDYERSQGVIQAAVVTDANGNKERTQFDSVSRYPTVTTRAYGTPLAREFRQSRDSAGHLIEEVDPLGRRSTYTYDAQGNPNSAALLAGTNEEAISHYSYTPDGQIASATDPLGHVTRFGYTNGCMTSVTNPLGQRTTMTCNTAGQVTSLTDPENHTSRFTYAGGDLVATTDPTGEVTSFAYDVNGRRISTTGPDGASYTNRYDTNDRLIEFVDPQGASSQWGYDGNGNLTSVTLPNGANVFYGFDPMNRQTSRADAVGRTMHWSYDAKGLLKSVEDAKHQLTTYSYDALDQMSLITFADGNGLQVSYDAVGHPVELLDSAYGTLSRAYDDMGRLSSETSLAGTVSYEYDLAGRRIGIAIAGRGEVSYGYDAADQLTSIATGSRLFQFAYDPEGRRKNANFPNGVIASYGYDALGRLLHLSYQNAQGQVVADTRYTYDASGRRVKVDDPIGSRRPMPRAVEMSFDNADQMTAVDGTAYAYDANGNLASDGSRTYVWDARNRLVQVKRADNVILDVAYDPLGRRSKKAIDGGSATTYLYDGADMIGRSSLDSSELVINGLDIDEHLAAIGTDGERYFAVDGINSTVALTDTSGQATSTYSYDPYGLVLATGEDNESLLYAGRERDLADIYFYRARYYLPAAGRFMSSDPLEYAAGQINWYAYVQGNPINFVDPYGLWAWGDPLPQWMVDYPAGLGDAASLGLTGLIRGAMGTDGEVNECSTAYKAGGWSSFALGAGRIAYAGLAKAGAKFAASGLEASAFRSSLRRAFGGGNSFRPPNLARYATDDALRSAAGRTNPFGNAWGAGSAVLGANEGTRNP